MHPYLVGRFIITSKSVNIWSNERLLYPVIPPEFHTKCLYAEIRRIHELLRQRAQEHMAVVR